jgi:hypothetical protein
MNPAENGSKYVAYVTRCGARVAGYGQGGSYLFSPLCYLRARFLSMYPAHVFVFRRTRIASKGLREASEGTNSMEAWERAVQSRLAAD